jgi:hypothetical protein
LKTEDLFSMSRNKTDHEYKESNLEWLVGVLRQLYSRGAAVKYAKSSEERAAELNWHDEVFEAEKSDKKKVVDSSEDVMMKHLQIRTKLAARKPTNVKQLLEQPHSRNALMPLAAIGSHFRQDESLWSPATLSRHFHRVNGGVCVLS